MIATKKTIAHQSIVFYPLSVNYSHPAAVVSLQRTTGSSPWQNIPRPKICHRKIQHTPGHGPSPNRHLFLIYARPKRRAKGTEPSGKKELKI